MDKEKRLYNFLSENWNLSEYPNIPSKFLQAHIHQDWNFTALSSNLYLDLTIVEKYPEKLWGFWKFDRNVNFNWEFLKNL